MNRLYWVGLAFNFEQHTRKYAEIVNVRIVEALARRSPTPISTTVHSDGTIVRHHMLSDGGEIIADIFDRLGARIGFGVLANSDDDAFEQSETAQAILADRMKICHRFEIHIWSWEQDAVPVAKPVMVV